MEDLGLERFFPLHQQYYDLALKEIKNGKKESCWMWYIFPQIRGLGTSLTSNLYGIKNIEEAKEYLSNEKLRNNLLEITQAVLDLGDVNIKEVMGYIDDIKLKSSMTLFNEVEQKEGINCGNIFKKVLHQFFNDEKDEKTKDADNIIYIGIFSLIKEMNNYRMDISGCKTQKIIKNKLKFELSIKNIKGKIKCTIPKLNSTEIDYFDISCKIRKNDYYIFLDDIVLNEIPTLKGYTFEGFERYFPRRSRKK